MADTTSRLNLVQKLAKIRQELKSIEKKGHNSFQKYDYLRAEDIAGEMGDRLAAMNVIVARRNLNFVQDNITVTKDGNERTDVHVIVTLDYVFIDGDDEQAALNDNRHFAEIVVASIGEGRDSGDKAVAKAMTNALKYALTQPLMMRIGDDPEADAPHDKDKGAKTQPADVKMHPYLMNGDKPVPLEKSATLQQRAALWRTALSAYQGDKEAAEKWLAGRLEDLRVTKKTMTAEQVKLLTIELAEFAGKREHVEPTQENDIGF